jgi:hypothetical protein
METNFKDKEFEPELLRSSGLSARPPDASDTEPNAPKELLGSNFRVDDVVPKI